MIYYVYTIFHIILIRFTILKVEGLQCNSFPR